MDDYQDPEMEARMAEMMGFSAFATKPDAKKRKTSEDTAVAATSSNAIPLGENGAHSRSLTHNPVQVKQQSPSAMTGEHAKNAFPTGVPMDIFNRLTWKELEAYRKGVKNENGDLAWFLPSFIEDPWAKLEKTMSPGVASGS